MAINAKSITRGENVNEDNIDEWFNYHVNKPGFEHLTDEQIVGGTLDTVSESEKEKSSETRCTVKHVNFKTALRHIYGLIHYIEE